MKRAVFVVFQLFFALILLNGTIAQELAPGDCGNGYDDDLDGYVDCYDTDCGVGSGCEDFFIHPEPACTAPPTAFPAFNMRLQWESAANTTANNANTSIGDLDGDGVPEVVAINWGYDKISILDGETGVTKYSKSFINIPVQDHPDDLWPFSTMASVSIWNESVIADVDRDGDMEIFLPVTNSGVIKINNDLTVMDYYQLIRVRPGNIGVADFDADGLSEIYARDVILDAETGTVMHASNYDNDNSDSTNFVELHLNMGGVAVDILPDAQCANCSGLELVVGGKIYSVGINRGTMSATLNVEDSIAMYPVYMAAGWGYNRTGTSVADYNLDGYLDVITAGNDFFGDSTRYYFWDVHNGVVQKYTDPTYNWPYGAGRPNLADLDGDGFMDATFVSGDQLYALDENWQLLWKTPIFENTSGNTGTTAFDFNGDGKFEVVYRDEQLLTYH